MEPSEFPIEQYRALRAEVIQSMDDGNRIIGFGLAAIGLLVNGAIQADETFLGFFVLAVMLPLLAVLIVSLWFAAQERLARAGHFLTGIEQRLAPEEVTWGRWLRRAGSDRRTPHFWSTEVTGIALFFLLAICSLGASFAVGGEETDPGARIVIVFLSAACVGAMFAHIQRRFRRWRTWLSETFEQPPAPTGESPSAGRSSPGDA